MKDIVKLQALNLAVRLWASDRDRCEPLVRYVLQLARYDRSYDIRDRCRLLRNCLLRPAGDSGGAGKLFSVECFITQKPPPVVQSQFADRDHFQLGTLSHLLNQKCAGYAPLPEFPLQANEEGRAARGVVPLVGVEELERNGAKPFSVEDEESDEDDEDEEEEDEDEEESESGEDETLDEEESEAAAVGERGDQADC